MAKVEIDIYKPCTWTEQEKRDKLFAILVWMSPDVITVDRIADDTDAYLDYLMMIRAQKRGLYGEEYTLDENLLFQRFKKAAEGGKRVTIQNPEDSEIL